MTPLRGDSADESVTLTAKIAFLTRPESYPERPTSIEAVETHMSWVFLTKDHAYKLKKPVRYDFLDFSTVEARRHDCQEEVRLNRRLAPGVYLGTLPIRARLSRELSLQGNGAPRRDSWHDQASRELNSVKPEASEERPRSSMGSAESGPPRGTSQEALAVTLSVADAWDGDKGVVGCHCIGYSAKASKENIWPRNCQAHPGVHASSSP